MQQLRFILLACVCLFSCKSPQKTVSGSKLNRETNVKKDILLSDENRVQELTDQIIKRLISEHIDVDVKNIKYDTEKPIDSITGKHPLSEEIVIKIRKETEVNETESIRQETDGIRAIATKDNSQMAIKTKKESKEKKETGLKRWQKALAITGGLAIVGLIICMIIKMRKLFHY